MAELSSLGGTFQKAIRFGFIFVFDDEYPFPEGFPGSLGRFPRLIALRIARLAL
jgi:hypothetical protein